MKKIVLMTDFSDNAKNAIRYAIKLFGNSADYVLANTYTTRSSAGSIGKLSRIIKERVTADLEKELAYIHKEFAEIPTLNITILCKDSEPIDLVNNLAKNGEADLIVMGTKGATGLSKVFIGSVTSSIIRNTKLPVLSIPEEAEFKAISKIVFAADLGENRKKELTAPLRSIALVNNAEVFLLHVLKEGELAENNEEDKMFEMGLAFDLEGVKTTLNSVEAENTAEAIQEFCLDIKADLLTVIARHNTFFDKLFHKSVSQELAFSLKMPLLTLEDSF